MSRENLLRPTSILSTSSFMSVSLDKNSITTTDQPVKKTEPSFGFLRQFDTRFLIDDSQTMFGNNWNAAYETLSGAASYCTKYNLDSFSVSFFHHKPSRSDSSTRAYIGIGSMNAVQVVFGNVGPSTSNNSRPIAKRLKTLIEEYFTSLDIDRDKHHESKPLKAIIITNGIPTDDVGPLLASIQHKIVIDNSTFSPDQVSIEFWQVGSNGPTTNFYYKTGRLRGIPPVAKPVVEDARKRRSWKRGPKDPQQAIPSKNFLKFMGTNLLQSAFLRT